MDIITVRGLDDDWDRFVWRSPGGTIFHTLKFLSYHPPSRFDFVNLAIRDEGRLAAVITGGRLADGPGSLFKSPVGASFGGFVFSDDCDLETMERIIEGFGRKVRDMGFDGADLTLAPICYSPNEHQSLGFLLTSAGYSLTLREATFVVPIDRTRDQRWHPALARSLRKAKKSGLNVREAARLEDFYSVLLENLGGKDVSPTHTLDELRNLFALFPDKLVLFEAVFGDRVVGGCLLILCNDRVALAFYICRDPARGDLRIAEAVLGHAIEWLGSAGYKYLDLGTVSRDGRPDRGLIRFKSKFSPRTYVRERYHLEFKEARR